MGWLSDAWDYARGATTTEAANQAQQQGTDQANAALRNMYELSYRDLEPWRRGGQEAFSRLASGDYATDLANDPGYQFRLGEGQRALEASASARGNLNSGATMKALTRYGQDYASNELDKAYSRLSNLAGFGASANMANIQNNQQYGQAVSANYTGQADANAAAAVNQWNTNMRMLSQLARVYGSRGTSGGGSGGQGQEK